MLCTFANPHSTCTIYMFQRKTDTCTQVHPHSIWTMYMSQGKTDTCTQVHPHSIWTMYMSQGKTDTCTQVYPHSTCTMYTYQRKTDTCIYIYTCTCIPRPFIFYHLGLPSWNSRTANQASVATCTATSQIVAITSISADLFTTMPQVFTGRK